MGVAEPLWPEHAEGLHRNRAVYFESPHIPVEGVEEKWVTPGGRPVLFPEGERVGEWAVHRDRAAAWLEAKAEDTGGDPVMTLATNIAREMVRNTIKTKGLDMKEWPATRITEVAKALLDSQGEDGRIISIARREVEGRAWAANDAVTEVGDAKAQAAQ